MNAPSPERAPWWVGEHAWRKVAVWVTGVMFVILLFLTLDTLPKISAGSARVPAYTVINQRIAYEMNERRGIMVPVIGAEAPLFGQRLDDDAAEALVSHGKLTFQARNCMNCHTILGNGAYYGPDLTKAWLDPAWGAEPVREELMRDFLRDPGRYPRGFGTGRRMPQMDLTDEEVRAVIAFLKWTSAIDTNGFPSSFVSLPQGGGQ